MILSVLILSNTHSELSNTLTQPMPMKILCIHVFYVKTGQALTSLGLEFGDWHMDGIPFNTQKYQPFERLSWRLNQFLRFAPTKIYMTLSLSKIEIELL